MNSKRWGNKQQIVKELGLEIGESSDPVLAALGDQLVLLAHWIEGADRWQSGETAEWSTREEASKMVLPLVTKHLESRTLRLMAELSQHWARLKAVSEGE